MKRPKINCYFPVSVLGTDHHVALKLALLALSISSFDAHAVDRM